ncbi:dihydropyrimidinase [bacterium]|nr:dihydropyrimidinase [bacterium]
MRSSLEKIDLLISNGDVVCEQGVEKMDIGVRDGVITHIEPSLSNPAEHAIAADGKLVFPGFIDAHTHMGIPIMNTHSADDFQSGSIAAAFGGVTTIVDFTVQGRGQSLRDSVDMRLTKARDKCHVDFGLHVNVTNQPLERLDEIPQLIAEGFRNFKVFSTYRQAGMMINWDEFRQVLRTVDENGGLLFLHAEDNEIIESATEANVGAGNRHAIYHGRSRPSEAEASAIRQAAELAGELDAELYIVHLSSRQGLEEACVAKERGVKLHLETCPQYLVLTEDVFAVENGHRWITTPPMRTRRDVEALWQAVGEDLIDVVATDHCPFTIRQKDDGKNAFHLTPNGLPGVETLFPLLYTYGVDERRISMQQLVKILAGNPARLCGLYPKKGCLDIGADADLVIWDPDVEQAISSENLHGNADWSPYSDMVIAGKLAYTILRGQVLVQDNEFLGREILGELQLSRPRLDS